VNKKKIRLTYDENFDFYILGISSFDKDYRLIWNINNSLGFQLVRTDNHVAFDKKAKTELDFPSYIYKDEDRYVRYRFIANKSDDMFLLDELRNIDYILLIQGEVDQSFVSSLRKDLSGVENVQAVFLIDPGKLKNKQRLFFR